MEPDNTFSNRRIGILGKGGSGKSTTTVLLAKAFRDSGYQVCVLDADSTNTGIHHALGFDQPPVSLMDYFGGTVFSGGKVTCPVDDPTNLAGADIRLEDIPGQYYTTDKNGLFLFQLGKIGDKGPGAGCDGPISKIARDLRIHATGRQPVTLIDVKAGLEDSARGVITGMDWIITVVDPTTTSIRLAGDVQDLISRIRAGEPPATEHLENAGLVEKARQIYREARIQGSSVLLNRIRDEKIEKYVSEKLKEKCLSILGVIFEDPSISLSWLEGRPLEGIKANREAAGVIKKLEEAFQTSVA